MLSFSPPSLYYKLYHASHSQFLVGVMISIRRFSGNLGTTFVNLRTQKVQGSGTWNPLTWLYLVSNAEEFSRIFFPYCQRVLQAKYYTLDNFSTATLGYHSSYIWRSILTARAHLLKGIRWRIDNERSVRIWEDKQLSMPYSFKLSNPSAFDHDLKVSCLSILSSVHGNGTSSRPTLTLMMLRKSSTYFYVMIGLGMSRYGPMINKDNSLYARPTD